MKYYSKNLLTAALSACLVLGTVCINTQTANAQSKPSASSSPYGITAPISRENARKLGFTNFWLSDLGIPDDQRISSISEIDNVLYITEAPTPLLSAVSIENGRILWRQLVGGYAQPIHAPIKYKGSLYVNSQSTIYKINITTGNIERTAKLNSNVTTKGALSGSTLIFGSSSGLIIGVDLNSYQTNWSYKLPAPIIANPVAADGKVVVGDSKGHYALFNANTGAFIWQRQAFDAINATPLIHDKTVYVVSKDHTLYAENIADGKDRWLYRSQSSFTASPQIVGDILYEVIHGKKLVAINPKTGDKVWSKKGGGQPVLTTGGNVLVNGFRTLDVVDQITGEVKASAETDLPVKVAAPGPDGSAVLITPQGVLLRINPRQ